MNSTKKINVNFSSLVGLKAELLRKQTEVKEAKVKAESVYTVPKLSKKTKKLKDVDSRNKLNQLTDVDDINAHKKSKLMLEAKARLYERLKKSKKGNENFLVDFTSKSDESEEEEYFNDTDYDDRNSDPEESWVEYEDCFGRTRKCLRKDLPIMRKKDDMVKEQVMKDRNKDADTDDHISQTFVVQEKEPEIEIMRRKWDEQTEKLADKANIHYQDVLFDEARAHGVGYYAFSQDEDQRSKQQENLAKLRKQTEQKQKEMKELKDLRDKMEQNRLKAARIRQRIRAGLPAEPTEEEMLQVDAAEGENANDTVIANDSMAKGTTDTSVINSNEQESTTTKETDKEDSAAVKEDKIKALGELLGKRTHWREMSQEEWVDKRRKDRDTEFAPIYENFKSGGYLNEPRDEDLTPVAIIDVIGDVNERASKGETDDMIPEERRNDTSNNVEHIGINDSDLIGPMPPVPPTFPVASTVFPVPPVVLAPPVHPVPPVPSVPPAPPVPPVPPIPPVPSVLPAPPMPPVPSVPLAPSLPSVPLAPSLPSVPSVPSVPTALPVPPVSSVLPVPPVLTVPPVPPPSETTVTSVHNDSNLYTTNYPVNTEYNHQNYSWNMSVDPQTNYYATLNPMAMYQHPYYNYVHSAPYIHDASNSASSVQSVSYSNIVNAGPAVSTSHTATDGNPEPVPPVNKTIDEEKIAAGLKYLREKFEKRENA